MTKHSNIWLSFLLVLFSCGSSSNILYLLTPQKEKKVFEVQLEAARSLYNEGHYEAASVLVKKAYLSDRTSQEAAVLLGYIDLALIGVEPFRFIRHLTVEEDSSSEDDSVEKKTGANSFLEELQTLLAVSKEDYSKLGNYNNKVLQLPVIEPECAETSRSAVETLKRLRFIVEANCPFINSNLKSL